MIKGATAAAAGAAALRTTARAAASVALCTPRAAQPVTSARSRAFGCAPGAGALPSCSRAARGASERRRRHAGRPVALCFGLAALVGALSPRHASALHVPAASRSSSAAASGDWEGSWSVVRIAGDGNCLFRAVAQGAARLKGETLRQEDEGVRAAELREAAVKELQRRRSEIEWAVEGDFDSYCKHMRRNGVWGGEIELIMLSHVLRTGIDVALRQPSGTSLSPLPHQAAP